MAPRNENNNNNAPPSFFSRIINEVSNRLGNVTHAVQTTTTRSLNSFQNTTVQTLNAVSEFMMRAAAVTAYFLVVVAGSVLLLWLMVSTATVVASGTAASVRAYALWGLPSDAEIPLPFDFSHRNQRCGNNNNQELCAVATSQLHVQSSMTFTQEVLLEQQQSYFTASSSSWIPSFPFWSTSATAVRKSVDDETDEIEMPQHGKKHSSSSNNNKKQQQMKKIVDIEHVPFLEPAYDFIHGARYSVSLEMNVPKSAVCFGMITTQVALHSTDRPEPIFTAAASSAVGAHEYPPEFWLTKLARELLFLPIAIWIPHFGSVIDPPPHNLKFDLIQRFTPPKKVSNLIKSLNFSLFVQKENGGCCASSQNDCLRIFDPIVKIRVELTSFLARLHQSYPILCFVVIFIPTWVFVFSSMGALILGITFLLVSR